MLFGGYSCGRPAALLIFAIDCIELHSFCHLHLQPLATPWKLQTGSFQMGTSSIGRKGPDGWPLANLDYWVSRARASELGGGEEVHQPPVSRPWPQRIPPCYTASPSLLSPSHPSALLGASWGAHPHTTRLRYGSLALLLANCRFAVRSAKQKCRQNLSLKEMRVVWAWVEGPQTLHWTGRGNTFMFLTLFVSFASNYNRSFE